MTKNELERIAVLEANQIHINAAIKAVDEKLDDQSVDLKAINNLLQNAKGARWAVIALATLGGAGLMKIAAVLGVPFPK
jgi:tRNA A22 N-methylase